MPALAFFCLRTVLHLAAGVVAVSVLQSAAGPEWRLAAPAIFMAATFPLWYRRGSLLARLGTYTAGLVIGGGFCLLVLPALRMLDGHQAGTSGMVLLGGLGAVMALGVPDHCCGT